MNDVRLIDATALVKAFEDAGLGDDSLIESVFAAGVYSVIERAPTIDAVAVVHGRWIDDAHCSNCLAAKPKAYYEYLRPKANLFCHECGARMDGGTLE